MTPRLRITFGLSAHIDIDIDVDIGINIDSGSWRNEGDLHW